jgi:hypothetical protein
MGAEPKKPVKKRVIKTVWMSFAAAVPNGMIVAIKTGIKTGHFRP